MRQFYLFQKSQPVADQLCWTHYQVLLSLKDVNEINYYIDECLKRDLSRRELIERIKHKEYQRLDGKTKAKLVKNEETTVTDFVKNPIIIKTNGRKIVEERILKELILEKISVFLKELGPGFCFIDSEYKIRLGKDYNYIDLLLFNIEFNCYVVVELKITELKKEHIGQIEFYMNYIDKNIRKVNHDATIGIIICKKENRFVIDYCSDKRIIAAKYIEV